MKNICLSLSYDGSDYYGFQEQEGLKTIAGIIRPILEEVTSHPVRLIAAGRTDKGVHALDQRVNFLSSSNLPAHAYKHILNDRLPEDIACRSSFEVDPSFHSRFMADNKEYSYKIERAFLNPIYRKYIFNYSFDLDLEKMYQGAKLMEGLHDFFSFSVDEDYRTPLRRVNKCQIEREGTLIIFRISGESFLRRQVRMMVGALLLLGRSAISLEEIKKALAGEGQVRTFAVPASALCLDKVDISK